MHHGWKWAVACAALLAAPAFAQTNTPVSYLQQATTGIVGMGATQNARLNVLNLNIATATAQTCNVQLAFTDDANNVLKQATFDALAPQKTASLTLSYAEANAGGASGRAEIRGVAWSNLSAVATPASTTTPATAVIIAAGCTMMTTLEIYDAATGATQVLTSDARNVSSAVVTPLITVK